MISFFRAFRIIFISEAFQSLLPFFLFETAEFDKPNSFAQKLNGCKLSSMNVGIELYISEYVCIATNADVLVGIVIWVCALFSQKITIISYI